MTKETERRLQRMANEFRLELVELLHDIRTGHPGGSLSCAEILTTLYFDEMNVSGDKPDMPHRDRLVLSKGHAAPMLYIVLAHKGFFPTEELKTLRQLNSRLQGHPCAGKTPGVEMSSGPLGLGLGAGLGMALAEKLSAGNGRVYVVLGDGELDEGCVWESAMAAAKFNPGNLIAIIDHNGVQLDGVNDDIMPLGDVNAKFKSFGWDAIDCDGHSAASLSDALSRAKTCSRPVVINAKTVKGKGVSFMEGKNAWHGKEIGDVDYAAAVKELKGGLL